MSRLTMERPDIWQRGLTLATNLTGYQYLPKLPLLDGTIFACGYSGNYVPVPPKPKAPEVIRHERISKIEEDIRWRRRLIKERKEDIATFEQEIADLEKEKGQLSAAPFVFVPDGAMEWLLHEVGHWIAASAKERVLPNYGNGHEVEAWAFEDMVLGHLGPARYFAPPTQRDGTAFELSGPIPRWAFRHIEQRIEAERIAVEPFRLLWSEWAAWGNANGADAPWRAWE